MTKIFQLILSYPTTLPLISTILHSIFYNLGLLYFQFCLI